MSTKTVIQNTEQHAGPKEQEGETTPALTAKRQFVEPEVSSPVDVLEATTFFIITDSSSTEGV
ncbi:MAG: hypothetical protein H0T60_16825 [Acidobacteria bacterium]|nr:hypothetical protein [Acidobacteriota bacterium]